MKHEFEITNEGWLELAHRLPGVNKWELKFQCNKCDSASTPGRTGEAHIWLFPADPIPK